jgi:hypothetical protein
MTLLTSEDTGCEQLRIEWGQQQIVAELRRTDRRVLRIEVLPSGQVVIFAPLGPAVDEIEERVKRKGAWLFQEIKRVADKPAATPERRFVSGETHLLLGRQYRLLIEQGEDPHVRIVGSRLVITARRADDQAHFRRLLTAFYAITARCLFSERLDSVASPFIRRGLRKPEIIIRRLTKRWGSLSPKGRIVLNIDLVRASPMMIDYVISHELAHAFHPDHGKEWQSLLDTVMPDWKARKASLEKLLG